MTATILQGDALARLRELPGDSVHCVVTSPPYWGLRDYGTGAWEGGDPACDHSSVRRGHGDEKQATSKGTSHDPIRPDCRYCGARRIDQQIGLEETPEEWCAKLVAVFREVRRVLRPDGTLWLNIGDSYAGSWGNQGRKEERGTQRPINGGMISQVHDGRYPNKGSNTGRIPEGCDLKPKDLVGQPWMLAFALRADGWWLRSEIIWSKPNQMPESVTDRPTKAHEQVFLLTKSSRYFYDQEAVREAVDLDYLRARWGGSLDRRPQGTCPDRNDFDARAQPGAKAFGVNPAGRNLRSVWTIATDPLPSIEVDGEKLDHFASYPVELARRCILAGTSAKGCCPQCGAPWARLVEREFVPQPDVSLQLGVRAHNGQKDMDATSKWQGSRRGSVAVETTGWRPTCLCTAYDYVEGIAVAECEPPPVPCTALDPFLGSGRTALAAEELGRDCIGIELNPASVRMARAQLDYAKARRMIGDAPPPIRSEAQLDLF